MTSLDEILARGRRRDRVPVDVGGRVVEVEFEAIAPKDYEALNNEHTDDKGKVDSDALLPALAAACAVEDGDVEKWEAVCSGALSAGEANALYQRLILLNYAVPSAGLGKG